LEENVAAPGLENLNSDRKGSSALTTRHPYVHKKLTLTSLTSGVRSVGVVPLRTKATELVISYHG
jgi:hypothetical protein